MFTIILNLSLAGKRYRQAGSSRGGGYGGRSGSGRYDDKGRSNFNSQSDGINAMFAQAYQQVAASATGNANGQGGGGYTGYQY